MTVTSWHNPRCSKSRQTLALVEEKSGDVDVRHYLLDPPSPTEIENALRLLGISANELLRRGEKLFKDLGLKDVSDEGALIAAMATYPVLIERPVVFVDGSARIGRPPENVLEIL